MSAATLPFSARVGMALDRGLALVAPGFAYTRMQSRQQIVQFNQRMYAAAKPTDDADSWIPYDGDVNSLIRTSAQPVRARVRQLVRDFPYAKRAIKLRNALIIGRGIRMQARFAGAEGKLDRKANAAIEASYADWASKASLDETQSVTELQQLADRQLFECGEYFFIKRYVRGKKHPLRLQPMEADRVACYNTTNFGPGVEVESGIEYEKATGRPLAYHFVDDGYRAKTIRVPAEHVIHGFERERPGQMRGISPIAAAVMVAGNLADLLESELEAMRMASRYVGFVSSPDIPGVQDAKSGKNGKRVEHLDHATLQYLRTGDEITLAKIDRQTGTFEPYIKFNLRTFAVCSALTYELLSGDYDQISFSNLRGIRLDLAMVLQPIQLDHINWFCRPVGAAWLESALLTDPRLLPYARHLNPSCYHWIAPGMESPDRLKDVKASAEEMKLGINAPQLVCAKNGLVYEEVLDLLAEAKTMAEARGLSLGDVSTTLKNNPAAIMEE